MPDATPDQRLQTDPTGTQHGEAHAFALSSEPSRPACCAGAMLFAPGGTASAGIDSWESLRGKKIAALTG